MKRKIILLSVIMSVCFFLASCQKDLYHKYGSNDNVCVNIVWDKVAPDGASFMRLFAFPRSGSTYKYDFDNVNGGNLYLGVGSYKMLVVNPDDEIVDIITDDYDNAYVTTTITNVLAAMNRAGLVGAPSPAGSVGQEIRHQPIAMYVDSCAYLNVVENGNDIVMHPISIVDTIQVEIKNVTNLKYVVGLSAAITGLAPEKYLVSMKPKGELCTMTMPLSISGDDTIQGTMVIFGAHGVDEKPNHTLTVYVLNDDGNKYYYNYDVTDQINAWDGEGGAIKVEIPGLNIPASTGGGFRPEVGGWVSINDEIEL